MKLATTITSERGKALTKTGNEHILVIMTVEIDGKPQQIASMSISNNHMVDCYNFSCTLPSGEKLFNRIEKKKESHGKYCCGDHTTHNHLGCCSQGEY